LGTNNILLKNENSNIAGIIDFGDIALGDIARDFNGFYRNHGLNFTQKIIDSYPGELGLSIWERIKFYAKKQPFMIYYYSQIFQQTQLRKNLIEVINNEFENNSEIY
jgi:aminoglycoside phosphotransferase (APT) family kinase protein